MYSREFLLLQNEGFLLQGCLRSALVALKESSSAERGPLYVALFNYSIGLERLLKLSLILDHCFVNKGAFPTHAQIRNYGHNVEALYESALKVLPRYKVEIPKSCLGDDLDTRLIKLIAGFAISGRYFNLDALTGSQKSTDPLPEWQKLLDEIYERDVPPLKRLSNEEQIDAQSDSLKNVTAYIPATGFDGEEQSYEEYFSDHGKILLVKPELVWRFARMLVPFKNLLFEMDLLARTGNAELPEDFPSMWEFCDFCCEDKAGTLEELGGP